ncbi:hypothetical protein ALC62_02403 [Cyphomyrmex costatus]|uniref:Uncharacterized protein n=1 Tax=Cyphomyrmex costatus TaxID=456900 RepID=A0A195D306_9HYME|nr:hypothetical protein ALC62_02403 [Cyphomyrmex costatus]
MFRGFRRTIESRERRTIAAEWREEIRG